MRIDPLTNPWEPAAVETVTVPGVGVGSADFLTGDPINVWPQAQIIPAMPPMTQVCGCGLEDTYHSKLRCLLRRRLSRKVWV